MYMRGCAMIRHAEIFKSKTNTTRSKSKLAARYNSINLIFIVIILAITIVVAGFMLNNMAETASRDYARSYTMESVDILSLHLSKEILLVQRASQTPELIEWFSDEDDPEKRAAAFQKMELYARMQQLGGLNFAIFDSQNEYFIGEDMSFEAFLPVSMLDPLNSYDKWYFTTINSIFDFTMSTSERRGTTEQYLWLNQKVEDKNGYIVGVLSSALWLDDIFQDLFGLYDKKNALGFVIDHRGIIQMDSTAPATGARTETHVLTVITDVDFVSIINNDYLRIPSVYHGRRSEPEVIRLSEGDYRYMAIARVPNTNWITITFFDSSTLFDISSVLPPLITVVIALLVYLAASTILNRRLVFKPLQELTHSLSNKDKGIYGTDRDDEIGELALTTQTAFKELRDTAAELEIAVAEAHKANKSKSAFLANMSHEIRTPMNSIIGFSELAMDHEMDPKLMNYFSNILSNSVWLLQIINDILDLSKIESGVMELENIPFDLNDMFSACRTLILPKAQEKGLDLYFYAEPSLGKRLCGDPTRLRQVLVNLLSNAIKFTNSGIVKMQSAIRNISEDTVTVYFEVKDSGIGMTAEQLERVFKPFEQAESSITRNYGGTGLGLPITKSIIEMMGGSLSVESTSGVGSKFSFELVLDAIGIDNMDDISGKLTFNELEKPTFEGEILLFEDNTMNQQVITEHLNRVGLKCVVADNGKIGTDLIKDRLDNGEKQFDLIFMDMHMPVMDGLEAAAVIRDMNVGIPVVAMTANIMINDREIYSSLGMNDCVGKPFTSQELWRCLMKYFKPVTWLKEDAKKLEQTDMDLRKKLIVNFIKNNSGIFDSFTSALSNGDITLAHRIVHTLKSNAAQIKKTSLQEVTQEIEDLLSGGENQVTPEHIKILENELKIVLEELTPIANTINETGSNEKDQKRLDDTAVHELLEKLKPLLKESDPECLNYLDSLKLIPGSEEAVSHMENYDFKFAAEILDKLMEKQ